MAKNSEYIIWCDESVKNGEYYSHFYGGVLVQSQHLDTVVRTLRAVVEEIGITEEIKWQKVDMVKLPAFLRLMDVFFELICDNKVKVRIMFTQNANVPTRLTKEHHDNGYFLLYYQFFKHCFGLKYSNDTDEVKYVRAYFDHMPDTLSKRQQFKEYIKGLESTRDFQKAKIKMRREDITEIDSKHHLPLQFLDVILGAIQFRLNNLHLQKKVGEPKRGKRTIAKERLYKYINAKIRLLKPNFNIGISTGTAALEDRWHHPYRHWKFMPREFAVDETKFK